MSDEACRSIVGKGLVSRKVAVSAWALLDMEKSHGFVVPTQVVVPPLSNVPVQPTKMKPGPGVATRTPCWLLSTAMTHETKHGSKEPAGDRFWRTR